eukprot:COSAG05_NODE_300_length_11883_cov_12.913357_2_plen_82_part_00
MGWAPAVQSSAVLRAVSLPQSKQSAAEAAGGDASDPYLAADPAWPTGMLLQDQHRVSGGPAMAGRQAAGSLAAATIDRYQT